MIIKKQQQNVGISFKVSIQIFSLICFTLITIKTIININKKSSPGVLLLSWLLLTPLTLIDFMFWMFYPQSEQLSWFTVIIFVLKVIVIVLPKKLIFEASHQKFQINIIAVQEQLKRKVLVWYFWFCLRVLAIDYRQQSPQKRQQIQERVNQLLTESNEQQEQQLKQPKAQMQNIPPRTSLQKLNQTQQ